MSLRVLFMGTPDFAVPTLAAIAAGPDELVGVVTQPDKARGRDRAAQPTPVKAAALATGAPVLQPPTLRDDEAWAAVSALAPDVCVVVAYGQILRERYLNLPRFGCINVHASLLPRWRGAAPINWAVASGDSHTGICIMQMERGLDTGPVISRWETPIGETETAGELHDRLAPRGARMVAEVLARLRAGEAVTATPQPEEGATYARMLGKDDGAADFTRSPRAFAAHVNGMTPWPGVTCATPDGPLKLCRARAIDGAASDAAPGTVLAADPDSGVVLATGGGSVRVLEVQRPGKRVVDATAFVRGYRGDACGQIWS